MGAPSLFLFFFLFLLNPLPTLGDAVRSMCAKEIMLCIPPSYASQEAKAQRKTSPPTFLCFALAPNPPHLKDGGDIRKLY